MVGRDRSALLFQCNHYEDHNYKGTESYYTGGCSTWIDIRRHHEDRYVNLRRRFVPRSDRQKIRQRSYREQGVRRTAGNPTASAFRSTAGRYRASAERGTEWAAQFTPPAKRY